MEKTEEQKYWEEMAKITGPFLKIIDEINKDLYGEIEEDDLEY